MGEITLSASTLIPLGSIGAFLAVAWYMSTKVSEIKALQESDAAAKKVLEDAVRKADFDKHVIEDTAIHLKVAEDISQIKLVQARDSERWLNIERLLQTIQEDLKKVLKK